MQLKTFHLAIEIIIIGLDPPNTASTKHNPEPVNLKIHLPSPRGRAFMVRATKLKVIVFYLGHRFDSAFRENKNLCELQGKTTNNTEITETTEIKPWPYYKSSFKIPAVK